MLVVDVYNPLLQASELDWISKSVKRKMAELACLELYRAGEVLFQGRENCESFHIVISGNLEVLECGSSGEQLRNTLYEKEAFGVPFFYGKPLNFEGMVVASSQTLVLSIPIAGMQSLIADSAEDCKIYNTFKESFEAYQFIKNYTTFGNHLSTGGLVEFVSSFEDKLFKVGDLVFDQGDDPDGYYICTAGLLKVIVTVKGVEVFTTELKAGDHFGELAMINSVKRAAAIRALQESRCYFLSLNTFNQLVRSEPSLMEGFKQLAKLAY